MSYVVRPDPQTGAVRYILDTKYKSCDRVAIGAHPGALPPNGQLCKSNKMLRIKILSVYSRFQGN
ncbi:MAG: hypothetical protein GDA48_01235 [Hormoscilla sp. GM102CHS1]|nr:hypothetical protein [Hormoscilla sp. GM102CHS1]